MNLKKYYLHGVFVGCCATAAPLSAYIGYMHGQVNMYRVMASCSTFRDLMQRDDAEKSQKKIDAVNKAYKEKHR